VIPCCDPTCSFDSLKLQAKEHWGSNAVPQGNAHIYTSMKMNKERKGGVKTNSPLLQKKGTIWWIPIWLHSHIELRTSHCSSQTSSALQGLSPKKSLAAMGISWAWEMSKDQQHHLNATNFSNKIILPTILTPGTQRFKSLTKYIHQSQILSSLSIMAVCESTLSSIPYFLLCKECNSFLTSITPGHEMRASEKDGYGFLPNKWAGILTPTSFELVRKLVEQQQPWCFKLEEVIMLVPWPIFPKLPTLPKQ
jgi:hypothetical protein